MQSEDFDVFLIEADSASDLLHQNVLVQLEQVRGILDYSRASLTLIAQAVHATMHDRISYSLASILVHSAQYLGETILFHSKSGYWISHDQAYLLLLNRGGNDIHFDVYQPTIELARQSLKLGPDEVVPILFAAFDEATGHTYPR